MDMVLLYRGVRGGGGDAGDVRIDEDLRGSSFGERGQRDQVPLGRLDGFTRRCILREWMDLIDRAFVIWSCRGWFGWCFEFSRRRSSHDMMLTSCS